MNIALCGLGKAGKKFVEHTLNSDKHILSAVLCRDSSDTAGKKVSEVTNVNVSDELLVQRISDFNNYEHIDVIVDFSNNPTTFDLVDICCKYNINLVICPTNFSDEEISTIKNKAEENNIGIVFAPTLTVGINMIIDFAQKLSTLFDNFSFEIIEKHSKIKGKPTKTAQIIGNAINTDEEVPISSVRLNGFVGVHEVIATNGYECISIQHESFSRDAFVNGALIAADYIKDRKGFYYIRDIFTEMIKNVVNEG